jgi:hypothetical protein
MAWKIKIKGEKYIAEVLSDDFSNAIFKADQWRSQGAEVWIEDANGNKVEVRRMTKSTDRLRLLQ